MMKEQSLIDIGNEYIQEHFLDYDNLWKNGKPTVYMTDAIFAPSICYLQINPKEV